MHALYTCQRGIHVGIHSFNTNDIWCLFTSNILINSFVAFNTIVVLAYMTQDGTLQRMIYVVVKNGIWC